MVTGAVTPNPTVVDPAFYQLLLTQDTARPNDDSVFRPISISYDPAVDMAELTFASDIDQLAGGVGTFRLRIGQRDDVVSLTNPQTLTPLSPADPSTVETALDLNAGAAISTGFTRLVNQDIGTTEAHCCQSNIQAAILSQGTATFKMRITWPPQPTQILELQLRFTTFQLDVPMA